MNVKSICCGLLFGALVGHAESEVQVLGIPMGVREAVMLEALRDKFGREPLLFRAEGDVAYAETHGYTTSGKLCGKPVYCEWWVGSNGLLTTAKLRVESEIGRVSDCIRNGIAIGLC